MFKVLFERTHQPLFLYVCAQIAMLTIACATETGFSRADASHQDTSANDARSSDTGTLKDSGNRDTGGMDTGSNDAGPNDGGSNDGGSNDSGSNEVGADSGSGDSAATDSGTDSGPPPACAAQSEASGSPTAGLFATGQNNLGQPLAENTYDSHYTICQGASCEQAYVQKTNKYGDGSWHWRPSPDNNLVDAPISQFGHTSSNLVTYIIQTEFAYTAGDPASGFLKFEVGVDDAFMTEECTVSSSVVTFINGSQIVTACSNLANTTCTVAIPVSTLKLGANLLEWHARNNYGPYGFRLSNPRYEP